MKCQKCNKQATFHITELIGADRVEYHLCEQHANEYLHKGEPIPEFPPQPDGNMAEALKSASSRLQETTNELAEFDFRTCPICGQSFQDFRKTGRLGCPNDFDFFAEHLEPLLKGIHGALEHTGRRPNRLGTQPDRLQLIRLRRELDDAVSIEDYERAGTIRDRIRELEKI